MTAPASAPEYGEFVYVRHIVGNPYGNAGGTTGVEYTVDIENLIEGGYMAIAPGSVPEPYTPPLGSRGVDPLNPALGQWAYVQNNVGTPYGVAGSTVGVEVTTHVKRLVQDGALSFTLPPTSQYDEFPLYSDNTFASLGMVKDLMYAYYGGYDGSEGDYSHLIISQRLRDAIAEEMSITYDPTVQALLDEARDYNADTKIARDAAKTSETNAKTSETNAKTSETNAGTSASQALSYRNTASTHASTATTKASEASTSATTATTKAGEAATSATNAKTSETNAKTSETSAGESADSATASAGIASTKAGEASASALAASESETRAETSETNAKTSETNAKTSETNAKTSETNAKTSETNAKTSETNALASKNAAATSATNASGSETRAKTSETNAAASATKAQQHAEEFDLTVTSSTLAPGAPATVAVSGDGPAYSLAFGVPKGDKGDKGDEGEISQAQLDAAVASLVDGSPEALNTLSELATALGNDPNFATTVSTEIGKRALIDGAPAAYDTLGKLVTALQNHELGGSTDAALLTGALTDLVNVGTSMVTFQYWDDVNGEPVDETSPLKDIITSLVSYGANFGWIADQLEIKADLVDGKVPLAQLPELGSTDAADLTGALTDQVDASDARVSGEMWLTWEQENGPFSASLAEVAEAALHAHYMVDAGLPAWIAGVLDNKADIGHTHDGADISGALTGQVDVTNATVQVGSGSGGLGANLTWLVSGLDSKSDVGHKHPVTDLTTTGTATSSNYLRGDGSWATPPNNTYSVPTQAEAEAGTATTGRAFSAQRVRQAADAAITAREWVGTQAQYNAIGTKNPNITYYIVD